MSEKTKEMLESVLFLVPAFLLYLLALLVLPLMPWGEGTGLVRILLANADAMPFAWPRYLMYISAILCAGTGLMVLRWIPVLTPGYVSNLFGALFFFLWSDTVFSFSVEFHSPSILVQWLLCLCFLLMFFGLLGQSGLIEKKEYLPPSHRVLMVMVWLLLWAVLYLVCSYTCVRAAFDHPYWKMPLVLGSLVLSFFNFQVVLTVWRSQGNSTEILRHRGVLFYLAWCFFLGGVWIFHLMVY